MNEPCVSLVLSFDSVERGALCRILEGRGYVATGILPGVHALAYVQTSHPDLVLYDIQDLWPEAVFLIRTIHEVSPGTRIVALRNSPTWKMFWDVLDAGGSDLIPKPYTPSRLLAAMDLVLGKVSA